jgi:hypothetical protein
MQYKLEDINVLNNQVGKFYGIVKTTDVNDVNNYFKIGSIVFNAVENEDDGYRSSLEGIFVVAVDEQKNLQLLFKEEPINVKIKVTEDFMYLYNDNESIISITPTLPILKIGTDHSDDYYPLFVFDYNENVIDENIDIVVLAHLND